MSEIISRPKEPHELISLEEAVERVRALELALQFFAHAAILMSNAKFNLVQDGRVDEPSGGYWINGLKNASLKPADMQFMVALHCYGAERAEGEFMANMRAMADAKQAAEDAPPEVVKH